MLSRDSQWTTKARWAFVCAVGLLFLAAEPAMAQRPRGRGDGRGTTRTNRSKSDSTAESVSPGVQYGRILEYDAAEGGSGEDSGPEVLGTLKLKPVAKESRVLKITIKKSSELKVTIAGHPLETENLQDLLWKGLYCSAEWGWDPTDTRKTPVKKELRGLNIDVFEVAGEIVAIEDDHIVLKARPADGRDWPHLPPKTDSRTTAGSDTAKRVRQLKVKLKFMDEVTKFTDAANHELDSAAFEVGQSVTASIAYGSKMGILAQLRTLTIDEDAAEAAGNEPGVSPGGGQNPGGPQVGPQPRGGRGGSPQPRGRGGRTRTRGGR